jgi:adenylate cyclase class 2
MAAHTETEIKFRLADVRGLQRDLERQGFQRIHARQREMNVLYDFPSRHFTRRGEILRLRQYGDSWLLTHKRKGKIGKHKSRVETETAIADGRKIEEIFSALGLQPVFRYEKFRSVWEDADGQVVIDETPIGNFAEVEGPPVWIDAIARKLRVREQDYITMNYASLFLEWKKATGARAREMTFAEIKR